ncbi:MAG: hypothetical protein II835_18265, partial [Fibrobacter sp.]|nr:hypothetical protein [Fibrobacter sp.]
MNKSVRKILRKAFISATAFCWMSCDNTPINMQAADTAGINPTSSSDGIFSISSSSKNPASSETPAPNSSSETPASSSSGASKAFINIEEELSKLQPTDTTELRGKCIPEHRYCETINGWSSHYEAESYARSIAVAKIEEKHKDEPNYWYGYNRCYSNLLSGLGNAPVYGVPECPIPGFTPCETEGNDISLYNEVHIDDAYIEALLRKEKDYYET